MSKAEDARVAGRLSIAYMMAVAGEVLRRFPVDLLDLLLVTTIANFNAMSEPQERPRSGGPASTARAGISRNAVSRAINVPLETVRRRVAGLIAQKVLVEQEDGLVFSPDNPIGLGNNTDLMDSNLDLLRQLFRDLQAEGVDLG